MDVPGQCQPGTSPGSLFHLLQLHGNLSKPVSTPITKTKLIAMAAMKLTALLAIFACASLVQGCSHVFTGPHRTLLAEVRPNTSREAVHCRLLAGMTCHAADGVA